MMTTTNARKYLTDETGKKIAVLLPIEEYEELLEDLSDLACLAERRGDDEPPIPFDQMVAELKQEGLLPNDWDQNAPQS